MVNFPNAITEVQDFYGRAKELDRIKRVFDDHKNELDQIERVFDSAQRIPVIIFGERRIGKTSLLNISIKRLQQTQHRRFVRLGIEPRGITSFTQFAGAILQQLNRHVLNRTHPAELSTSAASLQIDTIEQFEPAFVSILGTAPPESFLLCVDEFDEIVRRAPDQELAKVLGLILTIVEKSKLPLACLFTMTHLPDSLQREKPSPLISKSEPIELGPFQEDDLNRMIEGILRGQAVLSESDLAWFYQMTGGHPYFAKLLLSTLLERQHPERTTLQVTRAMLEQCLQDALDDPRGSHAVHNLYYAHFTDLERELLLLLAQREQRLSEHDLKVAGTPWITAARRLERRKYLEKTEQGFGFRIAFLRYWLRNWIEFDEECERLPALRQRIAEPVEVEVDARTREVRIRGQPARISAQEFRILECLAQKPGQIVDREQLIKEAWRTRQGVTDETIDTAIARLRKKMGHEKYIRTSRGQGLSLHYTVLIAQEP